MPDVLADLSPAQLYWLGYTPQRPNFRKAVNEARAAAMKARGITEEMREAELKRQGIEQPRRKLKAKAEDY